MAVKGSDFLYPKIRSFNSKTYRFQATAEKHGMLVIRKRLQELGYSVRTVYRKNTGIYIIYGRSKW